MGLPVRFQGINGIRREKKKKKWPKRPRKQKRIKGYKIAATGQECPLGYHKTKTQKKPGCVATTGKNFSFFLPVFGFKMVENPII